jgi:hypothetical protein
MSARRYITTVFFAALALQISLQAQECDSSYRRVKFHLRWPYTAQYRERHESIDYEGRTNPPQEDIRVVAEDSQGRHLDRWISADSSSHSQVRDPVAGEGIFWNTISTMAKVVRRPTAVPGRRFCWESPGSPDSEAHQSKDEPHVGWSKGSCAPAGHYPPQCRDACEAELRANALPPEKRGFPKCHPAERGGTAEDLGMDVIQGIAVHGCRTTNPFPNGKRKLREIWSDEYGLTLRDIQEHSTGDKYFKELISLSRDEPSLSTFQPPNGYEVVTLQMEEVPCEQPTPPSH